MATLVGITALGVVVATFVIWTRLMREVRVPKDRSRYLAAMGVGVVLGIAALRSDAGTLGSIAAWIAIVGGALFLGLRLQSHQKATEPAVKVGSPILEFSAPDDAGSVFDLNALHGTPFLLKFFRGHW